MPDPFPARVTMRPEDVRTRLSYARSRSADLLALNDGDLPGAAGDLRQQLTQEILFHLAGAIEFVAQLVNDERGSASRWRTSRSRGSPR
jgi:hypothetical protein